VAISFDSLWLLAEEHLSTTAVLHELPPEVLRFLTQALVLAGSAADDETLRKKYLDQVSILLVRFTEVKKKMSRSSRKKIPSHQQELSV